MNVNMKIDIVRCFYANAKSLTAAIRQLKREKRLVKDPCSCSTVMKVIAMFEETGNVLRVPARNGRPSLEKERKTSIDEALPYS